MKKILNTIKNKTNRAVAAASAAFTSRKAEGYVDSGVKILIAVVIGALLLAGLYTLFSSTLMPEVSDRITTLFNYNGKLPPVH